MKLPKITASTVSLTAAKGGKPDEDAKAAPADAET